MDISNLSKKQKIKKILEDNSKKKITISSTLFPKEKLEDIEMMNILDKIIDNVGFIAETPNLLIGNTNYSSKTTSRNSIKELTDFILKELGKEESIGIYQIGFDRQINKYSIRYFFYNDIGRKVRKIRDSKIDLILKTKKIH